MEDLSLHILDISENSIDAGAGRIEIRIIESESANRLTLEIRDDGRGMDEETLMKIRDPFFTTKSVRRFGLGIPLLAQAAEECSGAFSADSAPGRGTVITASFQRDHIDRKPLGDMGATMMALVGSHPELHFVFTYQRETSGETGTFTFDSRAFAALLDGIPLTLPDVLQLIRNSINVSLKGE
ncbi:MAG: ATP-binding protein [Nitrospirota bacterium]